MPVEPARNHEVDHEREFVLEVDDDPLAEPGEVDDTPSPDHVEGRVVGLQEREGRNSHVLEGGPADPGVERLDVHRDLGELRHQLI